MKGIALPIEVLVVVVVVVIVLLGLVAVYFSGWSPFAATAGVEGVKGVACRKLVMGHNCGTDPVNIEVTGLEDIDDLQELCDTYYGTGNDPEACKYVCGCGGVTVISGPSGCSCDWQFDATAGPNGDGCSSGFGWYDCVCDETPCTDPCDEQIEGDDVPSGYTEGMWYWHPDDSHCP
jgi:hypothetical protein